MRAVVLFVFVILMAMVGAQKREEKSARRLPKPAPGFGPAKEEDERLLSDPVRGEGNFYGSSGQLKSTNYPNNYENNENKFYNISAPEGHLITLISQNIELENGYDFLYIRDGKDSSAPLLVKLTGNYTEIVVRSSTNYLWLHFTSDSSIVMTGFDILYSSSGHDYESSCSQVKSTNYPNDYDNNELHYYVIVAPEGKNVNLRSAFIELEDDYDFLYIRDGVKPSSPIIQTLTGNYSDFNFTSPGNSICLQFDTDSTVVYRGFDIHWSFSEEE